MRRILAAAMLAALCLSGGCNYLGYLLYTVVPERKITRKAEFAALNGQRVAVVVYADAATLFEHPNVRTELAAYVDSELVAKVKGVQVTDPRRIVQFQDSNIHWDTMPMPEVGQRLGADYVLYLGLVRFSMREPGSLNLGRGQVVAQARLWAVRPDRGSDGCVWQKDSLALLHPRDCPVGLSGNDEYALRQQTQALFARKLVRFFYDYQVPESRAHELED